MADKDDQSKSARSTPAPTRKPTFPTSLSSIPTDLDRLYQKLGGPAPLRSDIPRRALENSCAEFSWPESEPVLLHFTEDSDVTYSHWPWLAYALSQYSLEREVLKRDTTDLNASDTVELLKGIGRSANELRNGLIRLQKESHSLADPAAPLRQPHLAYFDELISQAAAGRFPAHDNEEHTVRVYLGKESFLNSLKEVEVAASEAAKRVDLSLLKRKKAQTDPGLYNLVWRGAEIWSSLTRRTVSTSKVHSKSSRDPDFVAFLKVIVNLAGGPLPSRKEVEISWRNYRNSRTPDPG